MADDTYTVQRSTVVDAAPDRVYDLVADFRNWAAWSPWEGIDPDLQRTYSGAESGTGAVYSWSGNRKAGRGRMDKLHGPDFEKGLARLKTAAEVSAAT